MVTDKSRETQLRRIAKRHDIAIKKSRARYTNLDDMGGYRLIDVTNNAVVRGAKFELSLNDIADYFEVRPIAEQELDVAEELADILSRMSDLMESGDDTDELNELSVRVDKLKKQHRPTH